MLVEQHLAHGAARRGRGETLSGAIHFVAVFRFVLKRSVPEHALEHANLAAETTRSASLRSTFAAQPGGKCDYFV